MPFIWTGDTGTFTTADGKKPARFVLEQVSDRGFVVCDPFVFQHGEHPYPVSDQEPDDPGNQTTTDLASIPVFLQWFVSRHGRHTPAALVHDYYTKHDTSFDDRVKFDRIFLDAMDDLAVPPVRSRVMWSAVSMASLWSNGVRGKLQLLVWAAAASTGVGCLVWGLATLTLWAIAAALVGPSVGALLWGRLYWAGVIGGYALPFIVLPATTSLLGLAAYWVAEQILRAGRKIFRRNRQKSLPGPVFTTRA